MPYLSLLLALRCSGRMKANFKGHEVRSIHPFISDSTDVFKLGQSAFMNRFCVKTKDSGHYHTFPGRLISRALLENNLVTRTGTFKNLKKCSYTL